MVTASVHVGLWKLKWRILFLYGPKHTIYLDNLKENEKQGEDPTTCWFRYNFNAFGES